MLDAAHSISGPACSATQTKASSPETHTCKVYMYLTTTKPAEHIHKLHTIQERRVHRSFHRLFMRPPRHPCGPQLGTLLPPPPMLLCCPPGRGSPQAHQPGARAPAGMAGTHGTVAAEQPSRCQHESGHRAVMKMLSSLSRKYISAQAPKHKLQQSTIFHACTLPSTVSSDI